LEADYEMKGDWKPRQGGNNSDDEMTDPKYNPKNLPMGATANLFHIGFTSCMGG